MQLLEKKGKLFYNIADEYAQREQEKFFIKGHKKAITSLQWMPDDRSIVTTGKDCCIIRWDLESEKKMIIMGQKHQDRNLPGHFDEPLCSAVSSTGKFLLTAGKDRVVRVWDIHN